jgi:uridylate kinase
MTKERVLLKISGESMGGQGQFGINREALDFIAKEIVSVVNLFELAIVVGGGNIIRGTQLKKEIGIESAVADYAGMISTIINAISLQSVLERDYGLKTRVLSALEIRTVAEPYIRRRAMHHLEEGRVVIFAAGTGNPDFSTDTAMVLRAHEIGASLALKGTKVEGIFDRDPQKDAEAKLIGKIGHMDYLNRGLRILDSTAVTLAKEQGIPICVFNIFQEGNLRRALVTRDIGSTIA